MVDKIKAKFGTGLLTLYVQFHENASSGMMAEDVMQLKT